MSDALTDWSVPDDWPLESDCRWRANVLGELAQRLRRNPDCRPVLQADSPASVWLSVIVSDRERARVFVNRRYNGSDGYVLTIVSGEDAVRCDCNSLSKAAWLIGRSEGPLPTEECDTLLPLHLLYLQPLAERGYRVRCGFDFEDTVRRLSANELNDLAELPRQIARRSHRREVDARLVGNLSSVGGRLYNLIYFLDELVQIGKLPEEPIAEGCGSPADGLLSDVAPTTLEEYLADSKRGYPAAGTPGVESNWLLIASLEVPSGKLWIGDASLAWAEVNECSGCVTSVPPGQYRVEGKGIDFRGAKFVSRVRVVRDGASNIVLGDQVGIAGTDTGQIGVADPPTLKDAFEAAFPDSEKAALDSLESATSKPFGVFRPDSHGSGMLVFVPSGFGDGCGPVFGLLSHGQRIGIEHEFIAADSRSGA